ncbi:MAG: ABC transporter ATP-binding protein [Chloroflexi bacterium]|nr:ABC transporter ATP-binding protein [Chloroflexota bacterium]
MLQIAASDMDPARNAIVLDRVFKDFPRTTGYRDILTFWKRPKLRALDGVDLVIPRGGAFGLLGPNGAGKTTLLKILAGLVLPDRGKVWVNGIDALRNPGRVRDVLMYVSGEERNLYWRLTGRENLRFYAHLVEVPRRKIEDRVNEVLEIVGLAEKANEQVMRYSTGMKHRLAIARGLLSDPEILLLDEPTRSVDPVTARKLWSFIKDVLVGQQGRTVITATHNMEEASFLCSRVAILDRGQVKASDTVEALSGMLDAERRCVVRVDGLRPEALETVRAIPGVKVVNVAPPNGKVEHSLDLLVDDPRKQIPELVAHLVRSGCRVTEVAHENRSLTDVIVALSERSHS